MNAVLASVRGAVGRIRSATTAAVHNGRTAATSLAVLIGRTPVGRTVGVVTPHGRVVIAAVVVAWIAGRTFGWAELVLAAVLGAVVLLACACLTVGRVGARGAVALDRERVTAGESIAGVLRLDESTRRRILPLAVELPVGELVRRFDIPAEAEARQEGFTVDTAHRGVIVVGPATTVRGDPFGLLRRAAPLADAVELFVHPVTVALPPLAGGLLRDLEGRTTEDVSMCDLAFHALRPYVPGDDRRHIHWRSSARALSVDPGVAAGGAGSGSGLLVRQFNDTRRSHVMVVVDADAEVFAGAADAELAMSVGASVVTRAIRDELDTTVVAADRLATSASTGRGPGRARRVLDAFAQARFATGAAAAPLTELVARGLRAATDTTTALLVTGPDRTFADLRRAAAWFPPEVAVVAMRVDSRAGSGRSSAGALTVLDVADLGDLPALLRGGVTVGSRS